MKHASEHVQWKVSNSDIMFTQVCVHGSSLFAGMVNDKVTGMQFSMGEDVSSHEGTLGKYLAKARHNRIG